MKTEIQTMRHKAIAFIAGQGGTADRTALRQHLGIEKYAHSEIFNRAMKSTKIVPLHSDGVIGKLGETTLVLGRKPVIAYRLSFP
jgi:hypothetical protein